MASPECALNRIGTRHYWRWMTPPVVDFLLFYFSLGTTLVLREPSFLSLQTAAGFLRQQDVDDNKHLGRILEEVRRAQIAADERKLAGRGTKREKAALAASLARRLT